jgi:hypothetical protein
MPNVFTNPLFTSLALPYTWVPLVSRHPGFCASKLKLEN